MLTRLPLTLASPNTTSSSHWLVSKASSQFPLGFVRQLQSRPQVTTGEYQQQPVSASSAGVQSDFAPFHLKFITCNIINIQSKVLKEFRAFSIARYFWVVKTSMCGFAFTRVSVYPCPRLGRMCTDCLSVVSRVPGRLITVRQGV